MLRIFLGAIGVALIALGFSSDETLGWLGEKTGISGADDQVVAVRSALPNNTTAQSATGADTSPQIVSPSIKGVEQDPSVSVVQAQVQHSESSESDGPVAANQPALKETPIAAALSDADTPRPVLSQNVATTVASASDVATDIKKTVPNLIDDDGVDIDIVKAVGNKEFLHEDPQGASDAIAVALAGSNQSGNDDTLFVLKESVNLREGPSIEHPIVLSLEKGQELMEFKRRGRWVHVGAYGTSGTIGWVHRTLVGTELP